MMTKTQKLEKTMLVMHVEMKGLTKMVRMINNVDVRDQLSAEELATVNEAYDILKELQSRLDDEVPFMD